MHRMTCLVASMLLGAGIVASAQEVSPPVRLYESGQYEAAASQVSARADAGDASQEDVFWAGQSLVRLNRDGEAAGFFRRLGSDDENGPWRAIGQSAAALAEGQREPALQQAVRAVELGPDLFYAQYQHGLVRMDAQQWQPAADAFERATQIDEGAAYAHYYAGMAYNRLKKLDRMASHLNRFLELAPNAPEREQVQNVMRMLRGMR